MNQTGRTGDYELRTTFSANGYGLEQGLRVPHLRAGFAFLAGFLVAISSPPEPWRAVYDNASSDQAASNGYYQRRSRLST
jgi:hypothetical protein